ncbi:MAG: SDR family NAD(P)-dependent oxidoreductase [Pseudomonadota bacterium]
MTCVVTGAAHGLGRALVLALVKRSEKVLAVDFDAEALETLPCETATIDLTAPNAAEIIARAAPISLIIHCAGISGTGPFEAIPADHHAKILALNFEAPSRITCELLARGAMAPQSTHAFVGSLSTYTGYPGAVSYAASKDGLASFAASLNKALPRGQNAACIFPGPLATEHAARYAPDNSEKTRAARQDPSETAELILKALDTRKSRIFPGPKARILALLGAVAPTLLGKALKRGLYDRLPTPKL